MKKLYVGNLSYNTGDEELKSHFSGAGEITSAIVIKDKMTGRSKGFGFVEMANDDEADKAIETYNGQDFDGRNIVVNEARPLEDRPRQPSRSFGGGGNSGGYGGGNRGGNGGGYGR